jgi:hypothetical protein
MKSLNNILKISSVTSIVVLVFSLLLSQTVIAITLPGDSTKTGDTVTDSSKQAISTDDTSDKNTGDSVGNSMQEEAFVPSTEDTGDDITTDTDKNTGDSVGNSMQEEAFVPSTEDSDDQTGDITTDTDKNTGDSVGNSMQEEFIIPDEDNNESGLSLIEEEESLAEVLNELNRENDNLYSNLVGPADVDDLLDVFREFNNNSEEQNNGGSNNDIDELEELLNRLVGEDEDSEDLSNEELEGLRDLLNEQVEELEENLNGDGTDGQEQLEQINKFLEEVESQLNSGEMNEDDSTDTEGNNNMFYLIAIILGVAVLAAIIIAIFVM